LLTPSNPNSATIIEKPEKETQRMDSEKRAKGEEDEGEIPVLTVLKNNTILKNIFIVNKPPEEPDKASRGEHVDVLLVGRHPDCDLMLTHPSISRFHLQIRSKPSSRAFSVVDLSSGNLSLSSFLSFFLFSLIGLVLNE